MDHGAENSPSERIEGIPDHLDQGPTRGQAAGGTSVRPTIIDTNPNQLIPLTRYDLLRGGLFLSGNFRKRLILLGFF